MVTEVEIWKDIPGYEGFYQVSNLGRIYILPREVKFGNRIRHTKGKFMIGGKSGGYKVACLVTENEKKYVYFHRLVAIYFVPGYIKGMIVNHKDGNKTNNKSNNLEWCSYSENAKHAFHALGRKVYRGKESPLSKAVVSINLNGNISREYGSINEAAKANSITAQAITNCIKGRRKTANGCKWKFKEAC